MKIFNFYIIGKREYKRLSYMCTKYMTKLNDYNLLKKEYLDLKEKYDDLEENFNRWTDRDEKGRFVKKEK